VLPVLVAVALLAGARTPQAAVQRFVHPVSPADACAQLAPAYRKRIEAQYGPCVAGMAKNPKTTHVVFSHVAITGSRATLQVSYDANGSPIRERYSLARSSGIWLITGARQL
jgi:hypothetical protein